MGRAVGSADWEGRGDGPAVREGLGDGPGVRPPPGVLVPGRPGCGAGRAFRCRLGDQQHPAGDDQVRVGEGAAVGLGFPLVELVDLVPVLGVAEEPLGDVPQVVVSPGPGRPSAWPGPCCRCSRRGPRVRRLRPAARCGLVRAGRRRPVAEAIAACSGGALRVWARGTCSAVIMVAPTRAAASAWTGAIAGSLGAGWPRVTAISSIDQRQGEDGPQQPGRVGQEADDRAVGQRAGEEPLGLRPSGPGPGQRRPGEPGQAPGQARQQARDDGGPGCGAQQPPGPRGGPSHGSGPSMPRTGTAEAVARTVTACSPAADRICIGWTMVTVTVTRPPVAVAVPVAPMLAR